MGKQHKPRSLAVRAAQTAPSLLKQRGVPQAKKVLVDENRTTFGKLKAPTTTQPATADPQLAKGRYEKVPGTRIQPLKGGTVVRIVLESGKQFDPTNVYGVKQYLLKLAKEKQQADEIARLRGDNVEQSKLDSSSKLSLSKAKKKIPEPQSLSKKERKALKWEEHKKKNAEMHMARIEQEGREIASSERWVGRVVQRGQGLVWVEVCDSLSLPKSVLDKLGGSSGQQSQSCALSLRFADVAEDDLNLQVGILISFNVYTDRNGAGACNATAATHTGSCEVSMQSNKKRTRSQSPQGLTERKRGRNNMEEDGAGKDESTPCSQLVGESSDAKSSKSEEGGAVVAKEDAKDEQHCNLAAPSEMLSQPDSVSNDVDMDKPGDAHHADAALIDHSHEKANEENQERKGHEVNEPSQEGAQCEHRREEVADGNLGSVSCSQDVTETSGTSKSEEAIVVLAKEPSDDEQHCNLAAPSEMVNQPDSVSNDVDMDKPDDAHHADAVLIDHSHEEANEENQERKGHQVNEPSQEGAQCEHRREEVADGNLGSASCSQDVTETSGTSKSEEATLVLANDNTDGEQHCNLTAPSEMVSQPDSVSNDVDMDKPGDAHHADAALIDHSHEKANEENQERKGHEVNEPSQEGAQCEHRREEVADGNLGSVSCSQDVTETSGTSKSEEAIVVLAKEHADDEQRCNLAAPSEMVNQPDSVSNDVDMDKPGDAHHADAALIDHSHEEANEENQERKAHQVNEPSQEGAQCEHRREEVADGNLGSVSCSQDVTETSGTSKSEEAIVVLAKEHADDDQRCNLAAPSEMVNQADSVSNDVDMDKPDDAHHADATLTDHSHEKANEENQERKAQQINESLQESTQSQQTSNSTEECPAEAGETSGTENLKSEEHVTMPTEQQNADSSHSPADLAEQTHQVCESGGKTASVDMPNECQEPVVADVSPNPEGGHIAKDHEQKAEPLDESPCEGGAKSMELDTNSNAQDTACPTQAQETSNATQSKSKEEPALPAEGQKESRNDVSADPSEKDELSGDSAVTIAGTDTIDKQQDADIDLSTPNDQTLHATEIASATEDKLKAMQIDGSSFTEASAMSTDGNMTSSKVADHQAPAPAPE